MNAFDMERPVVAVSSDGGYVVTRADAELTVWAGSGTKVRTIDSRVPEAKPGLWYAVSRVGDLAEAFEDTLRLIDRTGHVRWKQATQGGPTAALVGGSTTLGGAMWGAPRFTPDGARLATLHQGGVAFWDPRTGKRLGSVVSGRFTLVRDIAFSADGRLAVLRCNSNAAVPANHTAFVVKLDANAEPVELPWHKGAVLSAAFASPRSVATLDERGTVSLYSITGQLEAQITFPGHVRAISTTGALDRVVAVGDAGRIWSWEKTGNRLTTLRAAGGAVSFLRLTPDARVEVVETAGAVHVFPFPGQATPTLLELRRYDEDPEKMKARSALWLLQREDYAQVIQQLQGLGESAWDARVTLALVYATLRLRDNNAEFGVHLREQGVRVGEPATGTALLSLAEDFTDASAIGVALDFFMAWFHARKVHADLGRDDDRGVAVGIGLAEDMSSNEDGETAGKLLLILLKHWPDRWDLTEAAAEVFTFHDADRAIELVNRYLSVHPSDLRAWKSLAEIHESKESEKPVIEDLLKRAHTYLSLSVPETHEFLAEAYARIDERPLAIRHYDIALTLAPDRMQYVARLAELGAEPLASSDG